MKKYEKHKAIAIPVSFTDDKPYKFLTVRDRRYGEWTFVTGGCRKSEISNPLKCALRELEEETRGTVNIKAGYYSYFNFNYLPTTSNFDKKVEEVTYHVYILDFNIPKYEELSKKEEKFIQKNLQHKDISIEDDYLD